MEKLLLIFLGFSIVAILVLCIRTLLLIDRLSATEDQEDGQKN